jgi:hypothetical protein
MTYTTTTRLGLKKAVAGTNQAFETSVFNANWDAIETDAVLADTRLDAAEASIVDHTSRIGTLESGGFITASSTTTFTNKTLVSPQEITTVSATAATGTINFDVASQADLYYTTNATANFTLNFRASSTAALTTILPIGSSVTAVFRNTNGTTAYFANVFQIDGVAVTPKWQGGSAPAAGSVSAVDVYSFVITRTGTSTYVVLASLVKFA